VISDFETLLRKMSDEEFLAYLEMLETDNKESERFATAADYKECHRRLKVCWQIKQEKELKGDKRDA